MRVVFDHQIFGWQKYGGISRYFLELANHLARNDAADVAIVSPLYVNAYLASHAENLKIVGKKFPAIRRTGRIYRAINRALSPSLISSLSPDIVHETYFSTKSQTKARCKTVLTVYDMVHERFPELFSPWDPTVREKAAAVERADHIICISEYSRQELIRILKVDPAKTTVVHLGFSLTQPQGKRAHTERRAPYILFVGGRRGYKNFEALLRAYAARRALHEGYEVVVFGGGALSESEIALMRELGLRKETVQHVVGDDSVLADYYRDASLFVYPSLCEGFGIPPLEAMSFDCPVACSNVSSIPEVVGDAAELFDPSSIDSIGQGMENVLNDTERRDALVARGRERVKMFSWHRCAEQTLDVYRNVLK